MRPPIVFGYHGVADVDPRHDPIRIFVSPDTLRWQIESMLARGYRFVAMSDFATLMGGNDMTGICALTFDDGTVDHATVLPEVLAEFDVPGTVYVCPDLLGEPYPWAADEACVRFMKRDELLEVARHPLIEIGSHTNAHTEVHEASFDHALELMTECKRTLEAMIGTEVPSFCYPRCHYSPAAPDAARAAGHTTAVTCGPRGAIDDPFELKRQSMHTPDGRVTFAIKSRDLYYGLVDKGPSRALRSLTRPWRHRRERKSA